MRLFSNDHFQGTKTYFRKSLVPQYYPIVGSNPLARVLAPMLQKLSYCCPLLMYVPGELTDMIDINDAFQASMRLHMNTSVF